MAHRKRQRAHTWLGVLTAGLLFSGAASAPPGHAAEDTGGRTAAPSAGAAAFGAYLHYGPSGISRMADLQEWLGGTELRVGHTYLPGDRWSNIEGRPGFLDSWAQWRRAQDDRLFVLNVPMLERNESHVPDFAVRQLLRIGAQGQYDHHFRALARRLVALGVPDTVIVLGWEMNGTTYTHRCGPDPEAWKAYWNRIVTTMRAVPGQRFRFDFAPNRGHDAIPWTECYPGDGVVDIVGMDSYDQPPGVTFDQQAEEPYGLRHHVEFAAAHGKAISYPEWGLFRNGDNPEYMRRMLEWVDQHRPLYHTITDYCPHGVWQCAANPRSARVFRIMLAGRGTEAAPEQSTPPGPAPETGTEPVPPGATPEPPAPETSGEPDPGATPEPPAPGTSTGPEPGGAPRPPAADTAPDPTVPTAPVDPTAPADLLPAPLPVAPQAPSPACLPVKLGSWVEKWLGGPVCVRTSWWERLSR
ncbi:glycoside hydrolase family 26 protein [Streptomyces sp. SP18CS02]|uniref:glycoside hydrolase family 26 protein n=1 Tax=Streptomyces sp. SP18CS02 TaxID=3002531 RepID=UPI002E765040|nr:glycosyl hydrolase [Streptomyces sp. SP18CS02]MEE1751103.1 glycosyl hydrolase [Streptomyces sp. SP18CS02]